MVEMVEIVEIVEMVVMDAMVKMVEKRGGGGWWGCPKFVWDVTKLHMVLRKVL